MAFNIGLSGLRASSVDLDVTGNNIANASTVGFKGSKAQFGDLYSSGFLSSGATSVGNGVKVQDVKQSFGQGNISATGNGLDMAIDGDGFFVLNNGGEIRYSRAGQFNIDQEGFVTNNQSMRVQGYTADDDGNLSGVRDDLQIQTDNLQPRRTTNLRSDLNLDSREGVLEQQIVDMGDLEGGNFTVGYDRDTTSFPEGDFTISYNDGTANAPVNIPEGLSAKGVADRLNEQRGLSASATTKISLADIDDAYVNDADFGLDIEIEGDPVTIGTDGVESVDDLITAINSSPDAGSLRASLDNDDNLQIIDNRGNTLSYNYYNSANPDTGDFRTQLGTVFPTADRSVAEVVSPAGEPYEDTWAGRSVETVNAFNPIDQRTYNHATSTTIYDSLGNSHDMTQFYVKEPSPGNGVGQSEWSVYLQIDGELVGGTDEQPHTAVFDQDGELSNVNGDPNGEILVTDWTPKDPNGQPNGADGPPADPDDVVSPIPDPPSSSAFVLGLGATTQYGSAFGVNDQNQNGYTTGRLSGLDVSDEGILFARYTNGQSKELGQVALAAFNNTDGLSPVGDTTWVETFESGQPIIGAPDTGTLGSITASSLEDSNVDLSAELVNLIIAQRNYQANAKTIETSDAVTQTVINLR